MDVANWDLWNARWMFAIGLVVMVLTAERIVPFRVPSQSKLEHVSINLVIFGVNSLVVQFLATWTVLVWSGYVGHEQWGVLHHLRLTPVANVLVSIVLLDFVTYGIHRLYHQVPFLWRLHRAHHSDLEMDATTSIRFHLAEVLVTMSVKGLTVTALGIPPVAFLISETLAFSGGLFSHANVRLPRGLERALRVAVVTPRMHWIHHSRRPAEHNANLGAVFSGWDRLFGTYFMGVGPHDIQFGLDDYPAPEDVTFVRFCRMPFDSACSRLEQKTSVSAHTVAPVELRRDT